ncbi:MAG TPA: hypothetical protein VI731_08585 [Bacteroidia bacterium]|nr:hypothetical protein [Bacteroidia bacterium]
MKPSALVMKIRNLAFLAFLFGPLNFIHAQVTDSIIVVIKEKYKHIRDNLQSYDTTETAIWDQSSEGGEVIGYFENDSLVLIEITYFGETGKTGLEFYFEKGQLIFVLDKHYEYNRPITDTVMFDPNKTKITEDRYYFYQAQLIRWLDNDKNEVDLTAGTNALVGMSLIAHANKIRDQLIK